MSVLSTNRLSSGLGVVGLGAVGLGTVAVVALLRQQASKQRQRQKASSSDAEESPPDATDGPCQEQATSGDSSSLKSRIGNFKVSKLKNMMQGIAESLDTEVEFDWNKAAAGTLHVAEHAIDCNNETAWERQVASESRTFQEAARVLHEVRGSDTHRKLDHFYVVDRQLSQMINQFREISEHVLEFPWREHRDDPISDLMKLAFVILASGFDQEALLPVSQGFVKHTGALQDGETAEDQASRDEALLGIEADASKYAIESAFRLEARRMHRHGCCIDIAAFHELNNAHGRCIARLSNSGHRRAYRGGSTDILAHYLLIGTDPSESRYGEAVSGLLDALQRERVLIALDVLRSWGEVSGTATGLGDG